MRKFTGILACIHVSEELLVLIANGCVVMYAHVLMDKL